MMESAPYSAAINNLGLAMTGTPNTADVKWKLTAAAALVAAGLLAGCGTSTTGPNGGSKANLMTGVSSSGYPAGQPVYAGSPALASSTEVQYSRTESEPAKEGESKAEAKAPAAK
jgi:hypothetical protein